MRKNFSTQYIREELFVLHSVVVRDKWTCGENSAYGPFCVSIIRRLLGPVDFDTATKLALCAAEKIERVLND